MTDFMTCDLPLQMQKLISGETEVKDVYYEHNNRQIHVTECLCPCLRKVWYEREIKRDITAEERYAIFRGVLFDEALTSIFKLNQVPVTYRVPNEDVVIIGKADVIFKDDFTGFDTVLDVKTIKNFYFLDKENKPNDTHFKQVSIYAYLRAIDYGMLTYFSMEGWRVFKFPTLHGKEMDKLMTEVSKNAVTISKCLIKKVLPEKTSCYLCNGYCAFKELCDNDRKC